MTDKWIEVRDATGSLICKVSSDLKRVQVKRNGRPRTADLPQAKVAKLTSE